MLGGGVERRLCPVRSRLAAAAMLVRMISPFVPTAESTLNSELAEQPAPTRHHESW